MKKKRLIDITSLTNVTINGEEFLNESRTNKKHFTRKRKMSFVNVTIFIFNFLSKALRIELDDYFEQTGLTGRISQQAFSKARQFIKPEAFQKLFEQQVEKIMEYPEEFKRYKGFRLFGVDGTELFVEPTKELIKKFKQKEKRDNCKSAVSTLCELHDRIILHAAIGPYDSKERDLALEHLNFFAKFKEKKDLFLFDRGYPSAQFIAQLEEQGVKYLMRVRKGFNVEIDTTDKEDFYINLTHEGKINKVRVIKLELPTGEIEMLLTNLGRKSFGKSEFKELYFMRWGVEEAYDTIKNKLEIESWSGKTYVSIMQDFWATMYLKNIASIAKAEVDNEIENAQTSKNNKHQYQANESYLIAKLKQKFVLCLLLDDEEERTRLLNSVIEAASYSRGAIRDGRSFPRGKIIKKTKKRPRKNIL